LCGNFAPQHFVDDPRTCFLASRPKEVSVVSRVEYLFFYTPYFVEFKSKTTPVGDLGRTLVLESFDFDFDT
jgi:hypothetical protein